jgi:hypothetical protein
MVKACGASLTSPSGDGSFLLLSRSNLTWGTAVPVPARFAELPAQLSL